MVISYLSLTGLTFSLTGDIAKRKDQQFLFRNVPV